MPSIERVAEEANHVAEYAGLTTLFTFRVETVDRPGCCALIWGSDKALVDVVFALGNLKNCPDKCTNDDLLRAIAGAHPDTLVSTG